MHTNKIQKTWFTLSWIYLTMSCNQRTCDYMWWLTCLLCLITLNVKLISRYITPIQQCFTTIAQRNKHLYVLSSSKKICRYVSFFFCYLIAVFSITTVLNTTSSYTISLFLLQFRCSCSASKDFTSNPIW